MSKGEFKKNKITFLPFMSALPKGTIHTGQPLQQKIKMSTVPNFDLIINKFNHLM
jgi:hypothetical protein